MEAIYGGKPGEVYCRPVKTALLAGGSRNGETRTRTGDTRLSQREPRMLPQRLRRVEQAPRTSHPTPRNRCIRPEDRRIPRELDRHARSARIVARRPPQPGKPLARVTSRLPVIDPPSRRGQHLQRLVALLLAHHAHEDIARTIPDAAVEETPSLGQIDDCPTLRGEPHRQRGTASRRRTSLRPSLRRSRSLRISAAPRRAAAFARRLSHKASPPRNCCRIVQRPRGADQSASRERQPDVVKTPAREPPLSVSTTLWVCATASTKSGRLVGAAPDDRNGRVAGAQVQTAASTQGGALCASSRLPLAAELDDTRSFRWARSSCPLALRSERVRPSRVDERRGAGVRR